MATTEAPVRPEAHYATRVDLAKVEGVLVRPVCSTGSTDSVFGNQRRLSAIALRSKRRDQHYDLETGRCDAGRTDRARRVSEVDLSLGVERPLVKVTQPHRPAIIRALLKGRLYANCDKQTVHCAAPAYRPAAPPHAECIASILYGSSAPLRLWQHPAPTIYPEAADMAYPTAASGRRSSIGLRLGAARSRPQITLIAGRDLAIVGVFQDGTRVGGSATGRARWGGAVGR